MAFRFAPPINPTTGKPPVSMMELIFCETGLEPKDDGSFEYDNCNNDVYWDTQEPNEQDGKVRLMDEDGETWEAVMTEIEDAPEPVEATTCAFCLEIRPCKEYQLPEQKFGGYLCAECAAKARKEGVIR